MISDEQTRVYLAAPWVDRDRAKEVADQFEAAGFDITHPWWFHENVQLGEGADEILELRSQAESDWDGVIYADVLVVLNSQKSEGKAVETGIALELGIPIIVIGKRSNIFHYLDDVTIVGSVEEAIQEAKRV